METARNRRRWFQFTLRTLFVATTGCALWLGYELNWIRQRHVFLNRQLDMVRAIGPDWQDEARPWATQGPRAPGMLWLFGEPGFSRVVLLIRESEQREKAPKGDDGPYVLARPDGEFLRAQRLFPEAEIVAVVWDRSPGNDDVYTFVPITVCR